MTAAANAHTRHPHCLLSLSRGSRHTDGGWDLRTAEEATEAGEPWPTPSANIVYNFSTDEITSSNGCAHCDFEYCFLLESGQVNRNSQVFGQTPGPS